MSPPAPQGYSAGIWGYTKKVCPGPLALLLIAIFVSLVFRYTYEKEIAVEAKRNSTDRKCCSTCKSNNLIGATAWHVLGSVHEVRNCIIEGLKTVRRHFGWSVESMVVWLDFHSIPQNQACSSSMQAQAISSLPIYASLSSIFVVVAPKATHADTGVTCDVETYKRRLWCRVELFSHYFRRGRDAMYLLEQDDVKQPAELASMEKSWLLDALFVFEGDCTCCFRKHDGMKCDKPFVRDLMRGLYAEVLNFKGKADSNQSRRACEIYESIAQQKDRVFPMAVSTEFTIKPSVGVGNVIGSLRLGNAASKKTSHQQLNLFKDILQELEALAASKGPESQDFFASFDQQKQWVMPQGAMLNAASASSSDGAHLQEVETHEV